MPDYQKMYHTVCVAASKAIDILDEGDKTLCRETLQAALLDAEEIYTNLRGGRAVKKPPLCKGRWAALAARRGCRRRSLSHADA